MDDLLQIALSNAVVATGLAVAAALAGRLGRRPALAHGLWLLVLVKLLTPPLLEIPVAWPQSAPRPEVAAAAEEPPAPPVAAPDEGPPAGREWEDLIVAVPPAPAAPPPARATTPPARRAEAGAGGAWQLALALVWLAGTAAWVGLACCRAVRFRRLLHFAAPAPGWLQEEVDALARRLGLRRSPGAWLVPGRLPPMLWSLGGPPRLLVPSGLLDCLTADQRATLLLHELAHLRRRDHWVRLVELLATGLFWWHPVVWWARRELREAEEQCCDAWVVWALPGAGRAYATALLECLDFLSDAPAPLPVGASGLGHTDDLKRRLTMIVRGATPRSLTWGGLLIVFGIAALLLPTVPTFAQSQRREERRDDRREERREGGRPDAADADRARAEVERLKKELTEQLERVRQTEERLRDAAARLGRAEGREVERGDIRIIIVRPGDRPPGRNTPAPPAVRPPQPPQPPGRTPSPAPPGAPARPGTGTGAGAGAVPMRPGVPGVPGLPGGVGRGRGDDGDRRIRDLERRLDELQRLLEEMRRQMRGGQRDRDRDGGREADPDKGGAKAVEVERLRRGVR